VNAAAAGNTASEASELDIFIADVNANSTIIAAPWQTRIASYANALRARL